MENKKKAASLGGKSFYLVLVLCAAVIGVSAWILLSDGDSTTESAETMVDIPDVVVTMVPAGTAGEEEEEETPDLDLETLLEEMDEDEQPAEEEVLQEVFSETVTSYVWPVRGDVEKTYAVQTLLYDATMADWRTHDGIDIACDLGTPVMAAAGGTVVRVEMDDLAGMVVEIDHANGVHTIYANLAEEPPVSQGDIVSMGQIIGSVGGTALGETNAVPHLHFAATCDGLSADPTAYLPTEWIED